ncbi:hypothetical protein J7L67_10160 [bacterium]|nr:hypothetical protein [bacterium]
MRKENKFSLLRFVSTFIAAASISVLFALVFVWQKNQQVKIGYRINLVNQDIIKVDEDIRQLSSKIQKLKSPEIVLKRLQGDFSITSSDNIVHLYKLEKASSLLCMPVIKNDFADHNRSLWQIVKGFFIKDKLNNQLLVKR